MGINSHFTRGVNWPSMGFNYNRTRVSHWSRTSFSC